MKCSGASFSLSTLVFPYQFSLHQHLVFISVLPSLMPTQPPIQWAPGFFLRGKAARLWSWPSPSGAKVKNEWSYTSVPHVCTGTAFPFLNLYLYHVVINNAWERWVTFLNLYLYHVVINNAWERWVTRRWTGQPGNQGLIPKRGRDFLLYHQTHTRCGANPACHPPGTRGFFHRDRDWGLKLADHLQLLPRMCGPIYPLSYISTWHAV